MMDRGQSKQAGKILRILLLGFGLVALWIWFDDLLWLRDRPAESSSIRMQDIADDSVPNAPGISACFVYQVEIALLAILPLFYDIIVIGLFIIGSGSPCFQIIRQYPKLTPSWVIDDCVLHSRYYTYIDLTLYPVTHTVFVWKRSSFAVLL